MTANRFIHEGRPLGAWLRQLVEDSSERRRTASRVITDRFYLPMEFLVEGRATAEELTAQFHSAIRETLRQPDFPATDFVRKLFSLSMELETQRLAESDARFKKEGGWQGHKAADNEPLMTVVTIMWIVDALGPELLPAAALIRHMLNETHQASMASGAICRMGAAAKEFYPDLLAGLATDDANRIYSKPLGILLQHNPSLVPEVFLLLDDPKTKVRNNTASVFGFFGRKAAQAFPEIEAKLRERFRSCFDSEWFACAWALASVAVTEESVSLLLEATHPPTGNRAPTAIAALGSIGLLPERVVPRLVELIDEFVERDPDEMYDSGWQSRVVGALEGFGSGANPAIPRLVKCIWSAYVRAEDRPAFFEAVVTGADLEPAVIKFLGSRGAAAKLALPALLEARLEMIRRGKEQAAENVSEAEELPPDDIHVPEYLLEAIRKIQSGI